MALKMHIIFYVDLIFIIIQLLFFSLEPVQTKNWWTAIIAFGVYSDILKDVGFFVMYTVIAVRESRV